MLLVVQLLVQGMGAASSASFKAVILVKVFWLVLLQAVLDRLFPVRLVRH
jgi:hypothetical protein